MTTDLFAFAHRVLGQQAFSRLLAAASVLGSGRTQAVCRCEVFMLRGDERTLCAAAQGTIRKAG